jgi:hypothetical protein
VSLVGGVVGATLLPADVFHDLVLALTRYVVTCGTGWQYTGGGTRGRYRGAVRGESKAGTAVSGVSASGCTP